MEEGTSVFELSVQVEDPAPERVQEIQGAFSRSMRWRYEESTSAEFFGRDLFLSTVLEVDPNDPVSEIEETTEVLASAIWKENGAFCPLLFEIRAATDVAGGTITYDEEDYERLVEGKDA